MFESRHFKWIFQTAFSTAISNLLFKESFSRTTFQTESERCTSQFSDSKLFSKHAWKFEISFEIAWTEARSRCSTNEPAAADAADPYVMHTLILLRCNIACASSLTGRWLQMRPPPLGIVHLKVSHSKHTQRSVHTAVRWTSALCCRRVWLTH